MHDTDRTGAAAAPARIDIEAIEREARALRAKVVAEMLGNLGRWLRARIGLGRAPAADRPAV